ncbi:hypothetical protein X943_002677 [Babesia divergens]|uniref:ubiquitinyl hydrolase 1 n=1 Tax=Babesia divergens TaxID=32595 RepID=A0AAD9LJ68_BABDI|nr:hypothetical protein X943_002677 [Babesia divergens]
MNVIKHCLGITKGAPHRLQNNSGLCPAGLDNSCNNCYCNAVLQALFPAADFRECAIRYMYAEADITSCLGRLYERCISSNGIQSAKKLLQKICSKNEDFLLGDQQDAHEFLTYLINTMIDEIKALDKTKHNTIHDGEANGGENTTGHAKPQRGKHKKVSSEPNQTWLSGLVEGSVRSETKCHRCQRISGTVEPFITLSLDIFENSSIEECIEQYCAPELLTGKDQFFCEFCNDYTDASKCVLFEQLPPILIIHLKRFKFNMPKPGSYYRGYHEQFERLQYCVISNRELLLESRKQPEAVEYGLFSIVCHVGTSPNYGHYVAISEVDKKWYSCDDLTITRTTNVSEEIGDDFSDGNPNSYILFYRMKTLGAT